MDLLIGLADVVDQIESFLMFLFDLLVGQFFVAELKNVLDDAGVSLQLIAERNDLPDDDGRTRQNLENGELTPLNALGDFDLAITCEQRDGSHFAEIHAN